MGVGTYNCLRAEEKIKVDGILDEPSWSRANTLNFFVPGTLRKPVSRTEGKLLWDDRYLYVGFKALDKDIYSFFKKRDDSTCQEDVLEFFFKTDPDKEPYYNFEINALNTVYDAFNVKKGAGGGDHHRWSMWNCKGLKSKVVIKGTLNNYKDVDEYWGLEVAIPFSSLETLGGKTPKGGDVWLFHLSRYDYSVYLPNGVELSSSAPLSKIDFHYCEDWQTLKFVVGR